MDLSRNKANAWLALAAGVLPLVHSTRWALLAELVSPVWLHLWGMIAFTPNGVQVVPIPLRGMGVLSQVSLLSGAAALAGLTWLPAARNGRLRTALAVVALAAPLAFIIGEAILDQRSDGLLLPHLGLVAWGLLAWRIVRDDQARPATDDLPELV